MLNNSLLPTVRSAIRIDPATASLAPYPEAGLNNVGLTAIDGGGFVAHWLVEARDGSFDRSGIAVQRFAANGTRLGGVTLLQGIPQELIDRQDSASYDLQALDNGGYALTYSLGLDRGGRSSTVVSAFTGQLLGFSVVGRPSSFFVLSAPEGVSYSLSGVGNNGALTSVALIPDAFGSIAISQAVLDQFGIDNRMTLQVAGVSAGESVSVSISTEQDVRYDPAAALVDQAVSGTATAGGAGVIFTTTGRPESFRIISATFANGTGPASVTMQLTTQNDMFLDLTGIPGATLLPNGTIQITGLTPDAGGVYRVPEALLSQLGPNDAQTILIVGGLAANSAFNSTIGSRPATVIDEGVFVQTFNANGVSLGDPGARIDIGTAPALRDSDDGESNIGLTALEGGGYVVHWLVDAQDGSFDASGIAVQRFDANGVKQGGVTVLQGVPQELIDRQENASYDLQALDNGGYALSYTLGLEHSGRNVSFTAGSETQVFTFGLAGRPDVISAGSLPAGAIVELAGRDNNGVAITVALGRDEFGQFHVSQAALDQFGVDNRLTLRVTGLTPGQANSLFLGVERDVRYDLAAELSDVAISTVVIPGGSVGVGTLAGRSEAFKITSATFVNGTGPTGAIMQITTASDFDLDITGISGASRLSSGVVQILGLQPDSGGFYRVPPALLAQLGADTDAQVIFIFTGLVSGSTLNGTISTRPATAITEGVFVQTFDSSGVSLGDPGPRLDSGAAQVLADANEGQNNVGVTALDGGGFVVHWLVDADDGSYDTSGIAVQRFAANGTKQGDVTVLQGLPQELIDRQDDASYDLQALDNGGYAITYSLQLPQSGINTTVTATVPDEILNVGLVGRPTYFYSSNAPANARFSLSGLDNNGNPITVPLAFGQDEPFAVDRALFEQFGVDNRINLQVTGLTPGQSASISFNTAQDVRYDQADALVNVSGSFFDAGDGFGIAFTRSGRPESFRIDSATYANGSGPSSVLMQITPLTPGRDINTIDLSGITGAALLPGGIIRISGVLPDSSGVYRVPPALLAQLGEDDAQTILIVGGLAAGSTLTSTIGSRPATPLLEGVFVQTFNAAGVAIPGGQEITGTAGADVLAGTAQGDVINGDAGRDTLTGGAGDDVINGGAGLDVAVYSVARSQAVVTRNANGTLTVAAGADGTDTLANVEQLRFSDGTSSFKFADPGGVLVNNFAVGAGGWSSQNLFPRHIADVNGDGFNDIVGFGFAGVLVSFGAANNSFSAATLKVENFGQTTGWASDNQFHRELADVNGDGRADIVGFGFAGTLVSLAQADGSFATPFIGVNNFGTAQGWSTQDGFARTLGDVNGDGKADIIGFGFAGALVSLGRGDGTFQNAALAVSNFGVAQGWSSDNQFHRGVADVNGDGLDDIVGFGQAGTLVSISNGDGTFGAATLALDNFGRAQGWATQDAFARTVADINNDGFADVVGFGFAGTLVAYGEADGTFGAANFDVANFGVNQGWTSNTTFHREIADINNDGFNDIVGFGFAGVLASFNFGGDVML